MIAASTQRKVYCGWVAVGTFTATETVSWGIGGTLALFVSGAAALAPVGADVAYQLVGGYPAVFAGLSGISLLAALAMLRAHRWR